MLTFYQKSDIMNISNERSIIMIDQRKIEKLANDVKEQAIKDWIHDGDFKRWFWDRIDDYELEEEDIKNINDILQKWVDN
jgi:hypothetical protein